MEINAASIPELFDALRRKTAELTETRNKSSKNVRELSNELYDEYLKEAQKRFNKVYTRLDPAVSTSIVPWLRKVAKISKRVDNSVKKLAALTSLLETIDNCDDMVYGAVIQHDPVRYKVSHALITKQAHVYVKNAFVKWDFDMAAIYLNDAADIIELAQAIDRGDIKTAKKKSHPDTIVREDMPDLAWDYIQENLR